MDSDRSIDRGVQKRPKITTDLQYVCLRKSTHRDFRGPNNFSTARRCFYYRRRNPNFRRRFDGCRRCGYNLFTSIKPLRTFIEKHLTVFNSLKKALDTCRNTTTQYRHHFDHSLLFLLVYGGWDAREKSVPARLGTRVRHRFKGPDFGTFNTFKTFCSHFKTH